MTTWTLVNFVANGRVKAKVVGGYVMIKWQMDLMEPVVVSSIFDSVAIEEIVKPERLVERKEQSLKLMYKVYNWASLL